MSQESIVEKIKALLRLADDQSGTPEGELAAKLALKMMVQHAIDQDMLIEKEKIVALPVEVGRSNWLRILLDQVGIFCSCKCWVLTGTRTMKIAGYESDIEIAVYLFDLIRTQIDFQCNMFQRGKSGANDFRMSAVYGVADKLQEIKRASRAEDQTGTALVLSRFREVEGWVNSQLSLKAGKGPGYNHDASGYQAGKNIRLSPGINAAGTPKGIGPSPKQLKG